jgi:hypothetical protein
LNEVAQFRRWYVSMFSSIPRKGCSTLHNEGQDVPLTTMGLRASTFAFHLAEGEASL